MPFFVIFIAMMIIPLVYAGYLSLFKQQLIGGESFAGLGNYAKAITDPLFLSGILRMGIFLVIQVPIMLALALFFALALDSGMMKLAKFTRLGIFVPYAVPRRGHLDGATCTARTSARSPRSAPRSASDRRRSSARTACCSRS